MKSASALRQAMRSASGALRSASQPPPGALKVDAEMPAHRHGMNYRTTVQSLGGGRWRADGLMFHMPGRWRFLFELDRAGQPPLRLTQDLDLP